MQECVATLEIARPGKEERAHPCDVRGADPGGFSAAPPIAPCAPCLSAPAGRFSPPATIWKISSRAPAGVARTRRCFSSCAPCGTADKPDIVAAVTGVATSASALRCSCTVISSMSKRRGSGWRCLCRGLVSCRKFASSLLLPQLRVMREGGRKSSSWANPFSGADAVDMGIAGNAVLPPGSGGAAVCAAGGRAPSMPCCCPMP